jgi:exosortase/archaeosortase family protein
MLKAISKTAGKTVDLPFLLRFIIKFAVFYILCKGFILAWTAIVVPDGRVYFAFCDNYLNFFEFIKNFVFQVSIFLSNLFNAGAYQATTNTLRLEGGGHLVMKDVCYGLGLMSVWVAFVLADSTSWKRKLLWCVAGIFALLLINSLRVTLLLIALKNRWNIHLLDGYALTHHTLFNIVAYALIFLLMYAYYKRNKDSMDLKKVKSTF